VKSLAAGSAALAAGLVVGGPLLAAGTSEETPPTTTPTDEAAGWRALAEERGDQLSASHARERRAWRIARRRLRVIYHLRAAMRSSVDPVRRGLLCIHRFEGSWSAATGNGYFGGLQMDIGFQATYGGPLLQRLGPANHWPVEAQLAVGTIAYYAGRGFGPWPNTRRSCGL